MPYLLLDPLFQRLHIIILGLALSLLIEHEAGWKRMSVLARLTVWTRPEPAILAVFHRGNKEFAHLKVSVCVMV